MSRREETIDLGMLGDCVVDPVCCCSRLLRPRCAAHVYVCIDADDDGVQMYTRPYAGLARQEWVTMPTFQTS